MLEHSIFTQLWTFRFKCVFCCFRNALVFENSRAQLQKSPETEEIVITVEMHEDESSSDSSDESGGKNTFLNFNKSILRL